MPYQLWSQDNFSKGELSPFMYGRAQVSQYYEGLKTAQNVLNYPTGAAGKRFGTLYLATLTGFTSFDQLFFQTFQYLDVCTFVLVFTPLNIAIYLEGVLQANVTTTLDAQSVYNIINTVLGPLFRVTGQGFKPYDLSVGLSAPVALSTFTGNQFVASAPIFSSAGGVIPIQFTTSGTLPSTTPQIKLGITYFALSFTTTNFSVYSSSYNAKYNIDPYIINTIGTGTNNIKFLNVWSFNHTTFKSLPVYDFTGGYDNLNFTLSAVSGNAVTLTSSGAIFTSAMVGGAFFGVGGSARITGFTNSTTVTVAVQDTFGATTVHGSLALLTEPAWSDARGWPQKCSSYQNRALFANTESLPNGFYASVVNDYADFGDLTTDDDDAISWYPTSNDINVIRFIVPFRSITVHTNSGVYSSPLSEIAAITPNTFTLQLQDSTPADVLQPQAIDNQIIVISGNDVHTMIWEGINNAYTSNIVSIVNEQTIRDPVDETPFADLRRAGSRYVFIVNASGSLAVYQTLLAEQVSGFTPQIMEQSYGSAKFLQVASNSEGRCWFAVQREIASPIAPQNITSFVGGDNSALGVIGNTFSQSVATAVKFTTSGSLPVSTPQIELDTYYWIVAVPTGGPTSNGIVVYLTQDDANEGVDRIKFTSAGINSQVVGWPLTTIFTMEELNQDIHLDCAVYYSGTPTDTVTTGVLFNAQEVKMLGNPNTGAVDFFGFDGEGNDNAVIFEAHGDTVEVGEAYIGFPINTIMEPMPLTMPAGPQTSLTKPNHIRTVRFMFNNTVGGTINGVPIALRPFDESDIGEPPVPARGVFEMSIMKGWEDFNNPSFTIEHNEPFDIQLIGVFYSVDN